MNKITEEFLHSEIVSVEYTRLQGTITHCAITVKNGFIFTGESACVNPEIFDEEIGKKIYKLFIALSFKSFGNIIHYRS